MAQIRGIGFPIKNDMYFKKGSNVCLLTDENKAWIEVDGKQITYPRAYFKVSGDDRLWLSKTK